VKRLRVSLLFVLPLQTGSTDLLEASAASTVVIFAVLNEEETVMRPGRRWGVVSGWMAGLVLVLGLARMASAQADYPFRDTKLTDEQRIADLLGRMTLEEKIQLMSDHPKFPRLGLAFSGQVEGLHGLALGGPT
jgi:hypothetical protein